MLNKCGYHYRQAMRKGLLIEKDLKLRMKFARDMKKYYDNGLWASGICFILMLRTLCIKQIQRTRQRFQKICLVWRKENEDLTKGCTSKGNKARHGSKVASFLLLYHLVKGFAIASITRNLVVSYWLNL